MKKKHIKALLSICVVTTMIVISGCGDNVKSGTEQNTKTEQSIEIEPRVDAQDNSDEKNSSVEISDMDNEELKQKYYELLDYTLFLEKEIVRLDGEVKMLNEQNDILKKKLTE